MAPTSSNTGPTDEYTRFNLGSHQSFIEASRALIRNTNSRIERMQNMSEQIKYLASQITDDRDTAEVIQLTPEVKRISNKKKNPTTQERPSIKVVIPIENEQYQDQVLKSVQDRNVHSKGKPKTEAPVKKKNNNSTRKGKCSPAISKEQNIAARIEISDAKNKQSITENVDKSVICSGDTNTKLQEPKTNVGEKCVESQNAFNDENENFHGKNLRTLPNHKRNGHRSIEFQDRLEVSKSILVQSKVPETIRSARLSSFTPTQHKTSIINLSLLPPAKSQYCLRNPTTKSFTESSCYSNCSDSPGNLQHQPFHIKRDKGFHERYQNEGNAYHNSSAVLARGVLQSKDSGILREESTTPLCEIPVAFRFRFLQKSKGSSNSYNRCSSTKMKYSTTHSHINKLSVS